MLLINACAGTPHRATPPDTNPAPAVPFSLINELFDPNADITEIERSAFTILFHFIERRGLTPAHFS